MRKRAIFGAVLPSLVAATLLAIPSAMTPPDQVGPPKAIQKNGCTPAEVQQRQKVTSYLARHSTKIEKVSATKTRYHLNMVPTAASNGTISWDMAAFHSDAAASAVSPPFTDGARTYHHRSGASIDHETSGGDCTGPDTYAYAFNVRGTRTYGGTTVANKNNIVVYGSLQTSQDGPWTNPWGYKRHQLTESERSCFDGGTGHVLADGVFLIRAKIISQIRFFLAPDFTRNHLGAMRSMASYSLVTGNSHQTATNSETGTFSGANPPSSYSGPVAC